MTENREKVRAYKKEYHAKNREARIGKMKEYNKEYYAKNRETILKKQKEREAKRKEKPE